MTDMAMQTQSGVIGFIPRESLDRDKNNICLEVDVELRGDVRVAVSLPITLQEFRSKLKERDIHSAADVRRWLAERATATFVETHPAQANDIVSVTDIYWICGSPPKRFQFLR